MCSMHLIAVMKKTQLLKLTDPHTPSPFWYQKWLQIQITNGCFIIHSTSGANNVVIVIIYMLFWTRGFNLRPSEVKVLDWSVLRKPSSAAVVLNVLFQWLHGRCIYSVKSRLGTRCLEVKQQLVPCYGCASGHCLLGHCCALSAELETAAQSHFWSLKMHIYHMLLV